MSQSEKITKAIKYSYILLFFLTPFLVSFRSFELFEFPKMLFVYTFSIIIATLWLSNIIYQGKIYFKKSHFDFIFLAILLTQTISTFLSLDPHTSLFGYYSRFHGGLLSTISYLILAWGFITHGQKSWVKNIFIAILSSASLVSLYAVAERFGIDSHIWVQDVQNRVYSTLGQPNWLAALLITILPITLYFWQNPPRSIFSHLISLNLVNFTLSYFLTYFITGEKLPVSGYPLFYFSAFLIFFEALIIYKLRKIDSIFPKLEKYNYLLLFILFLFTILFTKSRSGIIALFASLLVYFIWNFKLQNLKKLLLPIISFAIVILIVGTEWTPNFYQIFNKSSQSIKNPLISQGKKQNLPPLAETISESTDIRKIVWQGSLDIFKKYPIFGTGTESFAYSYYQFRPRAHNDLSEWDFLYNKAHNEYLNILANNGFLGLTAIFLLVSAILLSTIRQKIIYWLKIFALFSLIIFVIYLLNSDLINIIIKKLLIYPPIAVPLGISFLISILLNIIFLRPSKIISDKQDKVFLSMLIAIFITNFYGFSIVNIGLIFFLIPAFIVVKKDQAILFEKQFDQKTYLTSNSNILKTFLVLIVSISSMYLLITTFNYYIADRHYNLSKAYLDQGKILQADENIDKAIMLRDSEAYYYLQKALVNSQAAYILYAQDKTDSTDLIAQFTDKSEENILTALQKNPVHLSIYKPVAKIYLTLAIIDPIYYQNAYQILQIAQNLAPTDPQLKISLATLADKLNQTEDARRYFQEAVALKPNYRAAWLYYAQFEKSQNNFEKAQEIYQFILENIDPTDPTSLENLGEK